MLVNYQLFLKYIRVQVANTLLLKKQVGLH